MPDNHHTVLITGNKIITTHSTIRNSLFLHSAQLVLATALALSFSMSAQAQNVLDDTTPPGQAPGAPVGVHPVSGFESINLFNGHLNFRLPLLQVGGRGGAQFLSTLPVEQRWTIDHDPSTSVYHFPNYNWWTGLRPGYGPGVLQGRQMSEGCNDESYPTQGTTRLTFTASDGTEYELRDLIYGGQAASSNCNPLDPLAPGASRGTTFVTADGSSATFVSDATIYDRTYTPSGPYLLTPSGYLMLRDGTRYRIDNGTVTWLRDKNGNEISFTYQGSYLDQRITSATDSLNRQITYEYNVSDPTYGVCDRIIFKGVGGAQRIIRIVRTTLSNTLISGEAIDTYYNLFPTLHGSSSTYHNPSVVSVVWLPDGRSYQFRYNRYGELGRVDLPTGGRLEFSWTQFPQGWGSLPEINRRVTERRTYTETGALASRSAYGSYVSADGTQGNVQVDHFDFNGSLLSRQKNYFHGHPFSYTTSNQFDLPNPIEGREYKTELFHSNGTTILRRVETTWATCSTLVSTAINPCISQSITTLEPATANLVTKNTFTYDSYNNQTDVYEYGFGVGAAGSLMRRTHTEYLTTNPVNGTNYATTAMIHLRSLPKLIQVFDSGGVQRGRTTIEYDNYATDANHAGLVNRINISGLDSSFTTTYFTRGNATASTSSLLNGSGGVTALVSTYQQFDIAGNTVKAIDAKGNASQIDFADRFGAPDGNAQANSGAMELGSQVSFAFATRITNALAHNTYSQFDYYLGKPVDSEDTNGIVASFYHNDSLNRLTQVRRAVGTSLASQTSFTYDDVNRVVTTTSDLNSYGDNVLVNKTLYDGLGRTVESRQYEGGANYVSVQTQYDARGRAFKASNPFRPWQGESAVWSTQTFDALGRQISLTTPDNAVVTTSYSGNSITVSDQAGKQRKSVTDAMGRLVQIYEAPNNPSLNYLTEYTYDTLDSLTTVTQGSQTRTFVYDSLKRLTSATNPESGTISYQYDNTGNLLVKTDARNVSAHYEYDALSRPTRRWYNGSNLVSATTHNIPALPSGVGSSHEAKLLYDSQSLPAGAPSYSRGSSTGRLVAQTYGTGSNGDYFAFDALGQATLKIQQTGSINYQMNAVYNRAGALTSMTYPSGRTISHSFDAAGRLTTFSGNLGDGVNRTYSNNIQYSSFGGLTREQFGTNIPLYHKSFYNIRGQLFDTRLSSVNDTWDWNRGRLILYYSTNHLWGQSGTDNNGNVLFAETWIPPENATLDQAEHLIEDSYSYDALNRLASVSEQSKSASGGWVWQQQFRQAYTYDRYGNRTIDSGLTWGTGINNKQFTVSTANNRLGVPGGQLGVMSYDPAGNLTNDTYTGAGIRTYDAENKITSAWGGNNQAQLYSYDAAGQRIKRTVDAVETWQIYGLGGELVAEYPASGGVANAPKEYGYRNGQLLVVASAATGTNQSLSLNGTSGYVQAPSSSSLNIVGPITVEAWVKINAIGAYRAIVSREAFQQAGTGGGYRLAITDTGKVRLDLFQTHNTNVNVTGTTTITPGVWTHVAGVFDGSQMRVYLNGVLNGTLSTTSGPTTGTGNFHIGRFSYSLNPYYFNGLIDDARVSNAALYTSNFTPSNNLTASGTTKGLWKFNGLNTNDTSGNNNHGTVQGGATYSNDVPGTGGGDPPQVRWLVSDHLGTPRMIVDQSGTLANLKRHDYLPFGEELFAGAGGRTTQRGYSGGDGVRQQFTQQERDGETGLDYFLARYYSSVQGRFTSADSVGGSEQNPQTLNLYAYTMGNPLRLVDPTGNTAEAAHGEAEEKQTEGGCNHGRGALCMWQGQDPKKVEQKPPTVLGPAGSDGSREIPGDGDLIVSNINANNISANDGLSDTSFAFNVGGFAASGGEFYFVNGSTWRGLNGKTYNMNWGGNQYTGGRSLAVAKAGVFKIANKAFFFTGASISGYQFFGNVRHGNYAGAAKNGLDVGMSAVGTFGGPYGTAIGGAYFVGDTIGWKNLSDSHEKFVRDVERASGMPYRKYMGPIY